MPDENFAQGQTYHYVRNIMALARQFTAPAASVDVSLSAERTLPEGTPREVRTAVAVGPRTEGRLVPARQRLHRGAGRAPPCAVDEVVGLLPVRDVRPGFSWVWRWRPFLRMVAGWESGRQQKKWFADWGGKGSGS